jgi:hypothetical protein
LNVHQFKTQEADEDRFIYEMNGPNDEEDEDEETGDDRAADDERDPEPVETD